LKAPSYHVLVTGGTGFIGSHLAERLTREEGATVHLLARNREKADLAEKTGYQVSFGDLSDPEVLGKAVEGCELVFHCAHTFGLRMADALRVNVGGTRNLLEASLKEGVSRFIYISSVAVYGQTPLDGSDESLDIRPTGDPYSDSKIAAENDVLSFGRKHGLPVVILRPAIVYGPRSMMWSLGIIRSIQAKHPIVIGKGDGICNTLFVDNLVDAMILAAEKDKAVGEAFIITDGIMCTWEEYIGHYGQMLGLASPPKCPEWLAYLISYAFHPIFLVSRLFRSTPSWEPARFLVRGSRFTLNAIHRIGLRFCAFTPRDIRYFTHRASFDISKAREVLGYRPKIGLSEGMARTEEWLKEEGHLRG
jgi:nucleoside-diphosphate-sugar epimerase